MAKTTVAKLDVRLTADEVDLAALKAFAAQYAIDKAYHDRQIDQINARLTVLEQPSTPVPVPPPPVPPTPPSGTMPVRRFAAGNYANLRVDAVEELIFEPGAVLTGVLRWAAPGAVVRNLVARDMHETPIVMEPGGGGQLVNPLIEHTGSPSNGKGYSSIGANDQGKGVGTFGPFLVKGGTIDQKSWGWGGVEMWGVRGLVLDGVTFRGKAGPGANINAHISIPRSDGAIIRACTFDLTGVGWGMELADVDDVQVLDNIASAQGSPDMNSMWRAFVQMHPGGGSINGTTILRNRLTNFPALVNVPPPGKTTTGVTTIKDNCLIGVPRISWGTNPWPGQTDIGNNAPCP